MALAACGGDGARDDAEMADTAAMQPPMTSEPDTTAEAVWQHLQVANYRGWPMWPGKNALYPGIEPHGMLLTTYVNTTAQAALASGAQTLPPGSIIVKENYMPDSTYAGATVMYKRSGYNPQHNDWWFAKYNADGTVEGAGRVDMCQACHSANRDRDYLMTARQ